MSGVLGIFTGKNDLAKFLAIGGLFLIVFSLLYPLEKQKEMEIETSVLIGEVRELNGRVFEINKYAKSLAKEKDSLLKIFDSVGVQQQGIISIRLTNIKDKSMEYNSEISEKERSVLSQEEKINVLNKYTEEYCTYLGLLFWTGFIFSIIGFIAWTVSGISEHNKSMKA